MLFQDFIPLSVLSALALAWSPAAFPRVNGKPLVLVILAYSSFDDLKVNSIDKLVGLNPKEEPMRKHLIVAVGLLVLVASNASPAWAGWGCRTPPGTDPVIIWGPTEGVARASALGHCRSLHQECRIIRCIGNFDSQQQAIDFLRRLIKYSG